MRRAAPAAADWSRIPLDRWRAGGRTSCQVGGVEWAALAQSPPVPVPSATGPGRSSAQLAVAVCRQCLPYKRRSGRKQQRASSRPSKTTQNDRRAARLPAGSFAISASATASRLSDAISNDADHDQDGARRTIIIIITHPQASASGRPGERSESERERERNRHQVCNKSRVSNGHHSAPPD